MLGEHPKFLPQDDATDGYLYGEARGGVLALVEIPHPYRGLYLAAKLKNSDKPQLLYFNYICIYVLLRQSLIMI